MKAKHVPLLYILVMLALIAILVFVAPAVNASDPHVLTTTTTTEVTQITNTNSNYGLLALASSGLVFDCCRPGKLQWAAAGAFTEGGNQSFSGGLANNLSKTVLLNMRFATTIDSPNDEDDYAVVVGFSGAFR